MITSITSPAEGMHAGFRLPPCPESRKEEHEKLENIIVTIIRKRGSVKEIE